MADTVVATALRVQQWEEDFFAEYVRDTAFNAQMGMDENSVIQVKEQLGKAPGDKINIPLVTRLTGTGTFGDNTLEGNEENVGTYNHQLTVNMIRHAVRVGKMEQQATAIDILDAGKTMLKLWSMDKLRGSIIDSLYSPVLDGKTLYASATEAQKDAWLAANSDRVQAGALRSNTTTTLDHSTSLGNVDSTNDKLTTGMISLMKRLAKTASPRIRPISVKGGREYFILYAGSLAFRDLKEGTAMQQANRDARVRGEDNPIFDDGDLLWDGVIIKEIPEISSISAVGASSIDVQPVFLCGAQAVGHAWAQRTKTVTESFDYKSKTGVAIEEIRGTEKLMFNSKQQGLVTGYVSAVADT